MSVSVSVVWREHVTYVVSAPALMSNSQASVAPARAARSSADMPCASLTIELDVDPVGWYYKSLLP